MGFGPGFGISSFWGPRMESAGALAARWKSVIRRLQALDPAFAIWFVEEGEDTFQVGLEDAEHHIVKGRCDHKLLGYRYWVRTHPDPRPGARNFALWMNAGSMASNMAVLTTDHDIVPDPSLTTHRIFRAATLAVAEGFDVERAWAYPSALMEHWKPQHNPNPSFPIAWISYVAKRASHLVTPPPTAIVEHRPDGGLLMSATDDTFDVAKPAHMAVARDIEAATAPLHCHPWLPEDSA